MSLRRAALFPSVLAVCAFNVAIDNITYNVAAIPEPEAYALMLAGLGLVGYVTSRRRRA